MLSVHVVHDDSGRILAVADAGDTAGPGGVVLHHQPHPRSGQHAVVVSLNDEQRELHALALVRDFELDLETSSPALRRRFA
jgi:hypothetical protein